MLIRAATADDIPAITAIYAHHVAHGTGTFEEEPPSVEAMMQRREAVLANGLPWLVAERGGRVLGYCYAQRYHPRSAWRFTLEDAIYVAADAQRCGAGRALLGALITQCALLDYQQMIAVIGDSANAGSIGLHRACGFHDAGVLKDVGLKFGRKLDVVLMQRTLTR
ncbi:MAG: N-acetyltransferase family protein [Alphaproteobacteria bacterium]|nr:N-acetyltransferase family protein [Alphaproteobacteria bacterium]